MSELRRPDGDSRVRQRVAEMGPDDLYLSVITLGEVVKGIARLPHGRRKRELESWFLDLEQQFEHHVLPVDQEVARIWGELTAQAQGQGVQIPAGDGLIAATAISNGLHMMTRNTRDFAATGALIIDPWQDEARP